MLWSESCLRSLLWWQGGEWIGGTDHEGALGQESEQEIARARRIKAGVVSLEGRLEVGVWGNEMRPYLSSKKNRGRFIGEEIPDQGLVLMPFRCHMTS